MEIKGIWAKAKPALANLVSCTAFFVAVYLVAWAANGLYTLHFDLSSLQNFYLLIIGKQATQHSIDSIFNSPRGTQPGAKEGDKTNDK